MRKCCRRLPAAASVMNWESGNEMLVYLLPHVAVKKLRAQISGGGGLFHPVERRAGFTTQIAAVGSNKAESIA